MTVDDRALVWGIIFDHAYESCEKTYASLCIYHDQIAVSQITKIMGCEADDFREKGRSYGSKRIAERNFWKVTTLDIDAAERMSKDSRAHIFELLADIDDGPTKLMTLRDMGCEVRLWVFWSAKGHDGGPTLDHAFTKWLAKYPVELVYDFYGPTRNS